MTAEDLVRLLEYRAWARERILTAIADLPAADFTRPMVSSFPSVRETLVHVLSGDVIWSSRLGGVSPMEHLRAGDFPDLKAMRARWEQVDQALAGSPADPNRIITYRTFDGTEYRQPVWQVLQHVVNHQTYHFGQITTLLRQLGGAPPAIDLVVYDRR